MKCGFDELIECTEQCKYFSTCTRNPSRKQPDNKLRSISVRKNEKYVVKTVKRC